MAAVSETRTPEVVELRNVAEGALSSLLEREIRDWREHLDWDFSASADLVRRFVGMQALNGYALVSRGVVAGYAYFVSEERKGLIGDLYLRGQFRTVENKNLLLAAVLRNLMRTPYVRRIECQLMLLGHTWPPRPLPEAEFLREHLRNFMAVETARTSRLDPGRAAGRVTVENWSEHRQEAAARLIAEAYEGHIDSDINDQYRSVAGARRFLSNIVQYPGCGSFFRPAAFLATDPWGGRLLGMSLASLVGSDVGHITQICAAPWVKGQGVGYELLRRSLAALAEAGCRKVSLTVTSANTEAVELYRRVGFETVQQFSAYVWEGW